MSTAEIRSLQLGDEAQLLQAQHVMALEDFQFAFHFEPGGDFAAYIETLDRQRFAENVPADRVPATFLVAAIDGELAGRISIRHCLSDSLRVKGGHIGYGVLPRFRGHGLATQMLRRGLQVAAAQGVTRALITADEHNPASWRVIEKCGGVHERDYVHAGLPPEIPFRRYWVDCPAG